ncbi:MAG: OmpA family protein [Gammaproteobacteria bacterium]|nr:OmpA family protein [Gammaproteobacteria bacterium]
MKKHILFALLLLTSTSSYSDSLDVDRASVLPGQDIGVTLNAPSKLDPQAWIGIVPSNVAHGVERTNDASDVAYQYVSEKTKYTFAAPLDPGTYDFRLSSNGKELASVTFQVVAPDYKTKLTLPKNTYSAGETTTLMFELAQPLPKGAWIGLIPSAVPHGSVATNGKHYLAYQDVVAGLKGTLTFQVPEKSGSYDFRLNSSDNTGIEAASITFSVGAIKSEATLKLPKTQFLPGEQIDTTFTASETLPKSAWVGLVPSKVAHGREDENDKYDLQYEYVKKRTSGKMVFIAPSEPGSYDLRFNADENGGPEITSVTFQVGGKLDAVGIATLLKQQGKLALYGILFDFDKATLKPESSQVLSQIAEVLKTQPDLKLSIDGHTDNVGKAAYNLQLSRKRAQSVKDALVQIYGVNAARLGTRGFGDTKALAKNDNEAGRAQNRRVELVKQ